MVDLELGEGSEAGRHDVECSEGKSGAKVKERSEMWSWRGRSKGSRLMDGRQ